MVDLQKLLGRKVDVVAEKGLRWYIKERVLKGLNLYARRSALPNLTELRDVVDIKL